MPHWVHSNLLGQCDFPCLSGFMQSEDVWVQRAELSRQQQLEPALLQEQPAALPHRDGALLPPALLKHLPRLQKSRLLIFSHGWEMKKGAAL